MTHRQIYDRAKKLAMQHRRYCDLLAKIERKKYGFEFAETDNDRIIDSVNYGTDSYSFEAYVSDMKDYKKGILKLRDF